MGSVFSKRNVSGSAQQTEVYENPDETIEKAKADHKVMVFAKSWCPYCAQVKDLFANLKVNYGLLDLDKTEKGDAIIQSLFQNFTKLKTVPQVFVGGQFIGGCDDTKSLYKKGKLQELFQQNQIEAQF